MPSGGSFLTLLSLGDGEDGILLGTFDGATAIEGPEDVEIDSSQILVGTFDGATAIEGPEGLDLPNIMLGSFDGLEAIEGPEDVENPSLEIELASFDGLTAIQGPASVGTPSPQYVDLLSFDGATPVEGPFSLINVPLTPPDPFIPGMYAELWTAPPSPVRLSRLTTQSGVRFQDVFNDVGAGSLTIQLDDPDVALIVPGTEIRCYMFDVVVFTFLILEKPAIARFPQGEEAAMTVSISGRGRPAVLEKAKIYPPKGPINPVNAQHRIYSFASIDFPNFDTWEPAIEIWPANVVNPQRAQWIEYTGEIFGEEDVVETVISPAPIGWPIPMAFWIWSQDDTFEEGTSYFRKTFTLTAETNCGFFVTGDNYYTLYLDGTPLVGELVNMHCWQEYKRIDITLPAGTYTLAAVCINSPWPDEYLNPAGLLAAVCILDNEGDPLEDDDGNLVPPIVVTDSSWMSLPYPGEEPGWTPGQILIDAIAEAQARGVIPGFSYDFTAYNDSFGNPWPFVPGFSVSIGGSILDVLQGLVDQGWIDWRVKPGGQVLQMFNQTAVAVNSGVRYEATGDIETQNVRDQSFVPQVDIFNRYLVKWTYGYFEIEDLVSQGLYGVYEGFMTIDAPTIENAQQQAQAILDDSSTPLHAIVVEIDPVGDDDTPYWAYGTGEKVEILDSDGSFAWKQVQSITVNQSDLGRPEIALELEARLQQQEREDYELLAGLGRTITGDTKQRITRISWNEGKSATSS